MPSPEIPITYKYEFYDSSSQYLGNYENNVLNDFYLPQDINTSAAQIVIDFQLSVNRTAEAVEPLRDESGNIITNESGEPITIDRQPEYFEGLFEVNNRVIVTEFSQYNVNGVVLFDGHITKCKMDARANKYTVSALSNGADFDQIVIDDNGTTTITKGDTAPEDMVGESSSIYVALGGRISSFTFDVTGIMATYDFIFMTMLEVVQRALSLAPSDWYWYVDPGQLGFFFKQKSATANHTFIIGSHHSELSIEKDMERIKNVVYFTGGDTGGGVNLFKKYTRPASLASYGRRAIKLNDGRVTDDTTADIIAEAYLDQYDSPNYQTTITIIAGRYDISSIRLGQTVGFAGNGNYLDALKLQIVRKTRTSKAVTLDLGLLPNDASAAYEEVKRQLILSQTLDNPSTPS